MKVQCPVCGKEVDVTKHRKYAPHNDGASRCAMSGKRYDNQEKKNATY